MFFEVVLVSISFFTNIATIMSGITSSILFGIAIYTFYLTFISKRIKVLSFGFSIHLWESDSIIFVLKNKTLRTFAIKEIHVVFDKKYRLNINNYNEPELLKPLQSKNIKMKPFTIMIHDFTLYDFEKMLMDKKDIYVEITTDEHKVIYSQFIGKKRKKHKDRWTLDNVSCFNYSLGGIVLREDYAYVLKYRTSENGDVHTAFINNGGFISTSMFGFNRIPRKSLVSIEALKEILDEPCKELQIALVIQDVKKLMQS